MPPYEITIQTNPQFYGHCLENKSDFNTKNQICINVSNPHLFIIIMICLTSSSSTKFTVYCSPLNIFFCTNTK